MLESFLFLFTGIIGSLTIALMIKSYKSNALYNIYLSIVFVIISFRFIIHGSFELGLQNVLKPDQGPNSIFYLIIVPCLYLYYKNLALQSKSYNPKDLKHILFVGCLYIFNVNPVVFENITNGHGKIFNFILIIIFILFYITIIINVLKKNIWFKKDLLINRIHFKLVKNWTLYLFIMNVLTGLIMLVSISIELNNNTYLSGKSLALVSLFFWIFIYFKILATPEILYGLPVLNEKILKFGFSTETTEEFPTIKNNNWILDIDELRNEQDYKLHEKIAENIYSYTSEIDKLITKSLIFRNQKITPHDLANALGVPTSHIVYLFKYHSKITFSEYRMKSRINDSINLIENGYLKNNTLESLAYKTGFASYNPFFSAFKKITGYSPQDYLKTIKL